MAKNMYGDKFSAAYLAGKTLLGADSCREETDT